MKRLFTLLVLLLATTAGLRAQSTHLTQAVDFTATDCHGNEIHLFDILDRGQAVFIDFFFYTCGQCQTISPYITGAYTATGCNQHDVFFMEISYCDNDNVCQQWIDQYGVQFPTIGREGGGNEIFNTYGISACPTLVLIMPDRSIPIQGFQQLFPFSTNDVINALAQYGGIQQYNCEPTEGVDDNEAVSFTLAPNPADEVLTVTGVPTGQAVVYNVLGQQVEAFDVQEGPLTIPTAHYRDGVYLLRVNGGRTQRFVVTHE